MIVIGNATCFYTSCWMRKTMNINENHLYSTLFYNKWAPPPKKKMNVSLPREVARGKNMNVSLPRGVARGLAQLLRSWGTTARRSRRSVRGTWRTSTPLNKTLPAQARHMIQPLHWGSSPIVWLNKKYLKPYNLECAAGKGAHLPSVAKKILDALLIL